MGKVKGKGVSHSILHSRFPDRQNGKKEHCVTLSSIFLPLFGPQMGSDLTADGQCHTIAECRSRGWTSAGQEAELGVEPDCT
jgi:hypothetical protein